MEIIFRGTPQKYVFISVVTHTKTKKNKIVNYDVLDITPFGID